MGRCPLACETAPGREPRLAWLYPFHNHQYALDPRAPWMATCWGQLSETPSLAARLPVSPVPGRVVCAAGNDIVSGHLLAARSPVHCAVHLLRRGGNRGGPGEEMATHSSVLAWRIPWTEELVRKLHSKFSNRCSYSGWQSLTAARLPSPHVASLTWHSGRETRAAGPAACGMPSSKARLSLTAWGGASKPPGVPPGKRSQQEVPDM